MGFGTCAFYLNSLLAPPKAHFKNDFQNDPKEYHRMTTISFAMTTIFGFTAFASIWFNSLIIHWVSQPSKSMLVTKLVTESVDDKANRFCHQCHIEVKISLIRLNIKVTVMSEVISINISWILILFKVTEKDRNTKNFISIVLILLSALVNIFALIPSYNLK